MRAALVVVIVACGSDPVAPVAPVATAIPVASPIAPGASPIAPGAPPIAPTALPIAAPAPAPASPAPCAPGVTGDRGEWRYALVTAQLDPVEDISRAELVHEWRTGGIAAHAETIAALAPLLGDPARVRTLGAGERIESVLALATGRPDTGDATGGRAAARTASRTHDLATARTASRTHDLATARTASRTHDLATARTTRAIVPAHELSPAWKAIRVDGKHPLVDDGLLVVPLCGGAKPARNIDPDRITTLVMTGTTALTRRTAERIDSHGARDVVGDIAPWFRSADLVHISNEVAFTRDCDPLDGPTPLTFCSRDRYIQVLEELGTGIVELTGSHLIDYGQHSLLRTIEKYERRGWVWFGGGRTQLEATEPRIVEHRGNRLAFLGCNAVGTWLHALSTGAGVAGCDWPRMTWQIADLRRRGFIPIVAIQHQETAVHDPPPALVTDLRRVAEAGAAFVLGSQAHSAHPWDVHHGAYVHYGPGNTLFHQYPEAQREAAIDKLYFHAGKLLAVEHLYIRQEHGRPRLLKSTERARFLRQLGTVAAKLPPSDPWAAPVPLADPRTRPDSLVVQHGRLQHLEIRVPEPFVATKRYPLVVDLRSPSPDRANDDAIVVSPVGRLRATGAEIAGFVQAKYPVDPEHTKIVEPQLGSRKRTCRSRGADRCSRRSGTR